MIVVERKSKGITVSNVWYATEPYKKPGIHYYYEAMTPLGKDITPFRTFISDLTIPKEEIIAKYTKNTRYEIRRAEREGVTFKVIRGKEMTKEDVEAFCEFFHTFWVSKGRAEMTKEVIYKQIKDYVEAQCFCITKAISAEGEVLVYHTYIEGQDIVRLFQSASLYRVDGDTAAIGRANRFLHQMDMIYLKEQGIKTMDWGGAGESEDVARITDFKASFGGEVANYYNGTEITGIKAVLATKLLSILHK